MWALSLGSTSGHFVSSLNVTSPAPDGLVTSGPDALKPHSDYTLAKEQASCDISIMTYHGPLKGRKKEEKKCGQYFTTLLESSGVLQI
ncbi:hypothetical protein NDU88_001593 [Pleurodeles waltl]|uniref:Uncharacterized protein n=1 Tax=Pleurodeles waltl TaxID=8319 RepID=A0AAV7TIQ7_PLEWA|nr:hypothetical protein NDU88_001593 [Pleurodeles waltl]